LSQPLLSIPTGGIFDGLPPETLDRILRRLARRHFAAGAIAIAEGDRLHEIYIVESAQRM
jgi:hypothetical protein